MSEQDKPRPPLPPFDATTAAQKVRMAEAGGKIGEAIGVLVDEHGHGDA
jgi:nuclear transport factor 2 (NTF2) superfamily protein